jgi:hypothetical protein
VKPGGRVLEGGAAELVVMELPEGDATVAGGGGLNQFYLLMFYIFYLMMLLS